MIQRVVVGALRSTNGPSAKSLCSSESDRKSDTVSDLEALGLPDSTERIPPWAMICSAVNSNPASFIHLEAVRELRPTRSSQFTHSPCCG